MKKIISVLLAVVMCFTLLMPAFATDKKDTEFRFHEDGSFKILELSDFHFGQKLKSPITKDFIRATVKQVKPDLIVLLGDNMTGNEEAETVKKCENGIADFMDILEKTNIPVAWVFGNHDSQISPMKRQAQYDFYSKYSCSITKDKDPEWNKDMYGVGNFNIPIYSSTSDKVAFNLWFFDTGENTDEGVNEQGVHTNQLDWYLWKSDKLAKENGGKVPSLVFQHIVVPEIYSALDESPTYTDDCIENDGKFYRLPKGAKGYLREKPCPNSINYGEFDTIKEQGDVLAIFSGHDHTNAFDIDYKGIRLINTPQARMYIYGDIGSRGARVVELNENSPKDFNTYVLHLPDTCKDNPIDMIVFYVVDIVCKVQRFFETLMNKPHKLG